MAKKQRRRARRRRTDFTFVDPAMVDSDGDLLLAKRKRLSATPDTESDSDASDDGGGGGSQQPWQFRIRHGLATSLDRVGLQVWRGALLMAEALLSGLVPQDGGCTLELGCGTALAGIVAASLRPSVTFLTDRDPTILSLAEENAALNSAGDSARCRVLDWSRPLRPQLHGGEEEEGGKYGWVAEDVERLREVSVVLAADCIYDDDTTDAFLATLRQLQPFLHPGRCEVFLTLEKRFNFTLDDTRWDARASAYDHFASKMANIKGIIKDFRVVQPLDKHVKRWLEYGRGSDLVLMRCQLEPAAGWEPAIQ